MNGNGKKPKFIHQIYDDKVCVEQSSVSSINRVKGSELSDEVVICDSTENDGEVTPEITEESQAYEQGDVEIGELELDNCAVLPAETEVSTTITEGLKHTEAVSPAPADDSQRSSTLDSSGTTSSALQLNKPSVLSLEDPVKMMDSILNENGAAISQNINLLGKVELMDYLDSIDCSLEDFQAMLYGKQCGIDFDTQEESVPSKGSTAEMSKGRSEEDNTDKQLIQYTTCPLLAFLDGCIPPPDLDLSIDSSSTGSSSTQHEPSSSSVASVDAENSSEILDTSLESKQAHRSSLIRLEPLTEAEASEETLFYLCELSPAGPEADSVHLS